jgi:hypothetical protein
MKDENDAIVVDMLVDDQALKAAAEALRPAMEAAKVEVRRRLTEASIDYVSICYDGKNGKLWIDSFSAADERGNDLATLTADGEASDINRELIMALEDFTWKFLRLHVDGFEDDEGGYGRLFIRAENVAHRAPVVIKHFFRNRDEEVIVEVL